MWPAVERIRNAACDGEGVAARCGSERRAQAELPDSSFSASFDSSMESSAWA